MAFDGNKFITVRARPLAGFQGEWEVLAGGERVGLYPFTKARVAAFSSARTLNIFGYDVVLTIPSNSGQVTFSRGSVSGLVGEYIPLSTWANGRNARSLPVGIRKDRLGHWVIQIGLGDRFMGEWSMQDLKGRESLPYADGNACTNLRDVYTEARFVLSALTGEEF